MSADAIRAIADDMPHMWSRLVALNRSEEIATSPLDEPRLRHMVEISFAALCTQAVEGFLLAFDQDAAYASANFLWFRDRLPRFVYIDRIIIAPPARRRGLAGAFYAELLSRARMAGHTDVVCEVNIHPPNPVSDAFHVRQGFVEMGQAALSGTPKRVRYLRRRL